MNGLLLILALLLQNPAPPPQAAPGPLRLKDTIKDFPRSQLQPSVTGPVSIELNQGSRTSFETLAGLAGLNVIFDPDFRDAFTPLSLDKVDILDAFDRLSMETGNFVEVLNSKTILVAPNNATKRRDFETQVLKTIYLTNAKTPRDMTGIITTLRTVLNMRYLAQSTARNAIIIRDSPDRIAAAEQIIADLDRSTPGASAPPPVAIDASGNILTTDAAGVHRSAPARSELQLKPDSAVTINVNQDSQASFEALAGMVGLNIIFDRDVRSVSGIPLKLQNVDIRDALDFLSLQTAAFWGVLDSKTIMVAPRNQTKHRDYDQMFVKTIHLSNGTTPLEIVEIVTALRTLLNMRYIAQVPAANAIVIRETPSQLALAEKIIADLDRPTGNPPTVVAADILDSGTESGGVLRSRATRKLGPAQSQLQPKVAGPLSVDMNEDIRQSFERLAGMAGLHVTFDSRLKDGPAAHFKLKDVAVIDALDFLSLQTATFWEVLDSTTIQVAPDNQSVRRDLEPQIAKTIHLTRIQTPQGLQEVVTALRTLFNTRQVDASANAIVIHDSAEIVALAENFIADLDR